MDWLKERVWQLGLAIILAFLGAALIYLGSTNGGELEALGVAGFVLFAVALATPLISKAAQAAQEALDQEA